MRLLRFVVFLAALPLLGQEYTFEVSSIKPSNPPPDRRGSTSIDTGGSGLRTTNVSVVQLLEMALGAQEYQISGGPNWLRDDRYDILAKNDVSEEGEIPLTDKKGREARERRMRSRVRNLLAERFQLVLREEVKELPVYALSVDKGGPKLKAAEAKGSMNSNRSNGAGSLLGEGVPLQTLCDVLGNILDRPVVDETGLSGFYDIKLKYSLDNSAVAKEGAAEEVTGPSVFTAVRESLGLRLTGKKAPVKAWVIEKAEKPTEN